MRKKTIEEVSHAFEARGYLLLDFEYKDNKTPLRYICLKHPDRESKICYNSLTANKSGCIACAGRNWWTIEEVAQEFHKRNYQLLSKHYVSNKELLLYKCNSHPYEECRISLNNLRSGHGCPHCAAEKRTGSDSWLWRGGTSTINNFLRPKLSSWKSAILASSENSCWITGDRDCEVQVHHVIPYYLIRDLAISNLGLSSHKTIGDYSADELTLLLREFRRLHNQNSGVILRKDVHALFHKVYGLNVGETDLIEFRDRYLRGDFTDKQEVC